VFVTVTVTVNDARNLASAPSSFTLSVVANPTNGAPIIDPFTYPAVAKLDSPWQVQIPARDPDGDPLTYTVQSVTPAPTQLPTITATGLLQWNQPGPAQDCAIVVRVDDGRGGFATAALNVQVQAEPPNNPPQFLTLSLPGPATEGTVYRTTILAADPDGDPISGFTLDADSTAKGMVIANGGVLTWTSAKQHAGDHSLLVTVTDQRGATTTKSFALKAVALPENHPPQILTTGLGRATAGVVYDAVVRAADPDGDPFTVAITAGAPAGLTMDSAGVVTWPSPATAGQSFTITVVATDQRGLASDPVNLTLDVVAPGAVNNGPVIESFSYSPRASVGSAYQVKIPAGDPDGDPIDFSVLVKDALGTPVASSPPSSVITIDDNGLFVWNAPQTAGDFTFNVTVTDSQGASQSTGDLPLQVVAVPQNNPPTITTTDADMYAPGTGPATKDDPYQVQIKASDADGDAVTFSAAITAPDASPVAAADFSIDARTGLLTWNAPHQVGQYSVVATVDDGRSGGRVSKTLHVNVAEQANRAPIITTVQAEITNPAANVAYSEVIQAYDPDNNPIFFSLDAASRAKGLAIDNQGRLTWAPTTADAGTHEVTVTVTDNKATDAETFQLTVGSGTNAAPTITSIAPTKVMAGLTYVYDVNATDADGDPIEYVLDPLATPNGMTINATTGLVQWTPGVAAIGLTHAVRVKAYEKIPDGQGGFNYGQFDVQAFSVQVVSDPSNQAPRITSAPARLTTLDRLYGYNATASDPDGTTTFAWMLAKKPDGMAVDAETGRLRWQPQAYQVGDHEVVLRVSDLRGGSDTQTFTITVRATNQGPAITSDPVVEAVQSALYVYPIRAVDPEGDKVTFVVTATDPQRTKHAVPAFDPNHADVLSIDDQGVIRWKPTAGDLGDWTMDIVARDELGQGTRQVYRLAVVAPQAAADKPPVIVSSPSTVAAVNSVVLAERSAENGVERSGANTSSVLAA
jgi:hypothetical protein